MPIYQTVGRNGVTYRVNGPAGATPAQIRAKVLSYAPEAAHEKNLLEKAPLVGGLLSGAADLPLKAVEGAAGVTKTVSDLFGANNAVSRGSQWVADAARDLTSSQSKGDAARAAQIQKEAEGKGTWEEVKAAAKAFAQAPLDYTAQGAGSAVPFVAASLATEGAAAPLILGAASGAGMIKGDIYDAVLAEMQKNKKLTPEQREAVATKAQEYGGKNLDQIGLGAALGAIAGATGVTRSLANIIGRKAATATVQAGVKKGLMRRVAEGALEEGVPEGIQAGQERLSQNVALQREGVDTPTWKGVAGQAAMEGIMGGVLGGGLGPMHGGHAAPGLDDEAAPAGPGGPPLEPGELDPEGAALRDRYIAHGYDEETATDLARNDQEKRTQAEPGAPGAPDADDAIADIDAALAEQHEVEPEPDQAAPADPRRSRQPLPPVPNETPDPGVRWDSGEDDDLTADSLTTPRSPEGLTASEMDYALSEDGFDILSDYADMRGIDIEEAHDRLTAQRAELQASLQQSAANTEQQGMRIPPAADVEREMLGPLGRQATPPQGVSPEQAGALADKAKAIREQSERVRQGVEAPAATATPEEQAASIRKKIPEEEGWGGPPPVSPADEAAAIRKQIPEEEGWGGAPEAKPTEQAAPGISPEVQAILDSATPEELKEATELSEGDAFDDHTPENVAQWVTLLRNSSTKKEIAAATKEAEALGTDDPDIIAQILEANRKKKGVDEGEPVGDDEEADAYWDQELLRDEQEDPEGQPDFEETKAELKEVAETEPAPAPAPKQTADDLFSADVKHLEELTAEAAAAPTDPTLRQAVTAFKTDLLGRAVTPTKRRAVEAASKPKVEEAVDTEAQPELTDADVGLTAGQIRARKGLITKQRNQMARVQAKRDADKLVELQDAINSVKLNRGNLTVEQAIGPEGKPVYRVLRKDGGVEASSESLKDFEKKVMNIPPYAEKVSAGHDVEAGAPTVANQRMQAVTAKIKAAMEAGEIDAADRTMLFEMFERPYANQSDSKGQPLDPVQRKEMQVRDALTELGKIKAKKGATEAQKRAAEDRYTSLSADLARIADEEITHPVMRAFEKRVAERKEIKAKKEAEAGAKAVQAKLGTMENAPTQGRVDALKAILDKAYEWEAGDYAQRKAKELAERIREATAKRNAAQDAEAREKAAKGAQASMEQGPQRPDKRMGEVPVRVKAASKRKVDLDVDVVQDTERMQTPLGRLTRAEFEAKLKALEEETDIAENILASKQGDVNQLKREARLASTDAQQLRAPSKYRRGAPKEGGGPPKVVMHRNAVNLVRELTKHWKGISADKVHVLQSISELPGDLFKAVSKDSAWDAQGLVTPDGTIYIISDNHTSLEDITATLYHEGLGHLGLDKLFRRNLDAAMVGLYKGNGSLRADTDAWIKENPEAYQGDPNPLARAVEEVLAERSEAGKLEANLFQRIAAIIRNFARRMGIRVKITDGDVAAILSMAHDQMVRGKEESSTLKALRYMTAWHGTPHDFDRFSTDYINTGEGNQAYGWGLYFAEERQVSERSYRDALSAKIMTIGGKDFHDWLFEHGASTDMRGELQYQISARGADPEEMAASVESMIRYNEDEIRSIERALDADHNRNRTEKLKAERAKLRKDNAILRILPTNEVTSKSAGKLFEVELVPKNNEWLLWDQPLHEQSATVRRALKKLGLDTDTRRRSELADLIAPIQTRYWEAKEQANYAAQTARAETDPAHKQEALKRQQKFLDEAKALDKEMRPLLTEYDREEMKGPSAGAGAYRSLELELKSDKKASLALLKLGVRGVKYLDGFSRGPENPKQTHNFVLFSDEDVSITAKYRNRNRASKKVKDDLKRGDDRASVGLNKAQTSQNVYELGQSFKWFPAARDGESYLQTLKDNWSHLNPLALKNSLGFMPTSGIINWIKKKLPALAELGARVATMQNMKKNILKASDKLARRLEKFVNEHGEEGDKLLALMQQVARIAEASPDAATSVDDAMATNPALVGLRDMITKNSSDPVRMGRGLDKLIKEVVEHRANPDTNDDLRAIMRGLVKLSADRKAALQAVDQFFEHSIGVRDVMETWEKLGKLEGGQQAYKDMRKFYKEMFEAELALLDQRIMALPDKDAANKLIAIRADMMKKGAELTPGQKAKDKFWNLPSEWFPKDYFPFMREGKYWLRVKESGARERAFYTFHSSAERDQALRELAKEYGVQLGSDSEAETFGKGDNIEDLAGQFGTEDAMMQKVLEELRALRGNAVVGKANVDDVIDSVYQVWLMSAPERSVKRRFMHSDEVTGFSSNVLQHLQMQAASYANQLSKLAHAGKLQLILDRARSSLEGMPTSEHNKLSIVIEEMAKRVDQEVNPKTQSALVGMLNRASHAYFLTGAATALTQTTSIPIRTVPRLWKDHGVVEGTRLWMKYFKLWNTLSLPKWGAGEGKLAALTPGLDKSRLVMGSPLLQRAMRAGHARNILETMTGTLIENERGNPRGTDKSTTAKTAKLITNVHNTMSLMFTASENISRQTAYLMAFEAQHGKLSKARPGEASKEANFQDAVNYATEVVTDTLGSYESFERPRLLKSDWARFITTFKMYSMAQTKWMVESAMSLWRSKQGLIPGESRAEAREELAATMKEVMGVTMMAGLFGGLVGMPLYTVMTYSLMAIMKAKMDDDDEMRYMMRHNVDVATAWDPDLFFRRWIKERFGPPSIPGIDGKMHKLGDVFANGPISELSDTNVGQRTGMDIYSLWLRDVVAGDSGWDTAMNFIASNVAGVSMIKAGFDAKKAMDDGDLDKAMQKMAPAFARSWLAAEQMQREGSLNRKDSTIMSKEEFTAMNKMAVALGFRPLRLADWQDYIITRAKNDKRITTERQKVMQTLNKMAYEGASMEEIRRYIMEEEVPAFNRENPSDQYVITVDSLERSYKAFLQSQGRQVRGLQVTKKGAQKTLEASQPFMPG